MNKHGLFAFLADKRIEGSRHGNADYWIIYTEKSEVHVVLDQDSYCVPSGYVAIICADEKKLGFRAAKDFTGYALQINDPVSAKLVHRYLLLMNAKNADVHICAADKQEQSIRSVFENLITEMHTDLHSAESIVSILLQELLVRICNASPKMNTGTSTNITMVVSGVCAMLEKEYHRAFTLESIAANYNMSASYLSHNFKDITGVSLMRYLLLVRVRVAQEYLEKTSLPIGEVAEKSGFNDMSNFGRTFRKETGYSPRQYRQMHHQ